MPLQGPVCASENAASMRCPIEHRLPYRSNSKPRTPNPESQTPNLKPQTENPQAPNPKPGPLVNPTPTQGSSVECSKQKSQFQSPLMGSRGPQQGTNQAVLNQMENAYGALPLQPCDCKYLGQWPQEPFDHFGSHKAAPPHPRRGALWGAPPACTRTKT